MRDDKEHRIRAAFEEATLLTPIQRPPYILQLRQSEPEVAAEVESLLSHHDRSDVILDRTPAAASLVERGPRPEDEAAIPLPAAFGAYTLLRVIGEGGMGVVYEAEQASPRRRVALKLVRPDAVSASALRRFEHEAEALGLLDHPNIARVYESGRLRLQGQTRAFIAMELIQGPTLTEHARRSALRRDAALRIVIDLCEAVQFAHRRGVIHRDLKPGNILVDASGRPRILDFGVARLTDQTEPAATLTRAGQVVGTLAYMSPEQAAGDPARVDSRTDIYALGAVLFELLCGRAPVETAELSLHAALSRIQTQEPEIPRELRRALGQDLCAILLKSLEKDPARRYQHASEFAGDLRALLRDEPVQARGPSRRYQARMFCRRNRELVAAAVLVIAVSMTAFTFIALSLARERAAREHAVQHALAAEKSRDEAIEERTRAQVNLIRYRAVAGFLRSLLGGIRPEIARGQDTALLRQVLANAENDLHALDGEPAAQGDATGILAEVYRGLSDFEKAEYYSTRTVQHYTRAFGEEDRLTASAIHNLGALYRGSMRRYDEAEPLLRKSVEILSRVSDLSDAALRNARASLILLLLDMGKHAEAEPMLREQVAIEEQESGPHSPATLRMLAALAASLGLQGRAGESLALAELVYERRAATLGENNVETAQSLLTLAGAHRSAGDAETAVPLYERVVDVRSHLLGPRHHLTLLARGGHANALREAGRLEEALAEAHASAQLAVELLGGEHIDAVQLRLTAIELRIILGRCEGTREETEKILASLSGLGERYAQWTAFAQAHRGMALACANDPAAEQSLLESYQTLHDLLSPGNRLTRRIAEQLAWYYTRVGNTEAAARWTNLAAPPS